MEVEDGGNTAWATIATCHFIPPSIFFLSFIAICELMEGTAAATEEGKSRFERLTRCDESPGYELLAS